MSTPRRKTARRGAAVLAFTGLALGGLLAYPATATETITGPVQDVVSAAASEPAVDTTGLTEAIERDLGKTTRQYLEDSELNVTATALTSKLDEAGIEHNVVIEDDGIVVQAGQADLAEVTTIIGALQGTASASASVHATDDPVAPTPTTPAPAAPSPRQTPTPDAGTAGTEKPQREQIASPSEIAKEQATVSSIDGVIAKLEQSIAPSEITRLTSITKNAAGDIVIRAGAAATVSQPAAASRESDAPAANGLTLEQFHETVDGVELITSEDGGPAQPAALEDIYGGMGYGAISEEPEFASRYTQCSIGFNAWDPTGRDAVITAGHCSMDGHATQTLVTEQDGPGGEATWASNLLGTFGFNQFGMPGNTGFDANDPNWEDWPAGTDIAVIEDINPQLYLHAGVTRWPASGDERDQTIKITSSGSAAVGAEVCSSGRTSGWNCAEITEVGVFIVAGYDDSGRSDANDLRTVYGYIAESEPGGEAIVRPGDSGGAAIVGNRAVGINSAYVQDTERGTDLSMFTSLSHAMSNTEAGQYAIKLFVYPPEIRSPKVNGEIAPGATIRGTVRAAAAGTTVDVIVDGEVVRSVPVKTGGVFEFAAPQDPGPFSFHLQAFSGQYNESEPVAGSYMIVAETRPLASASQRPGAATESSPAATPSAAVRAANNGSPLPTAPSTHEEQAQAPLARTGASLLPALAVAGGLVLVGGLLMLLRGNTRRHG